MADGALMNWRLRAVGEPGGMIADKEELRRGLRLLADPEAACEVMALLSGRYASLPGNDPDTIAAVIEGFPLGVGVYVRLNPVKPGIGRPARNEDILRRRWIYIDVDPLKAEGHEDDPATDEEKADTRGVCEAINEHLSAGGWPAPVVMDSGNGYALLYPTDLPNDAVSRASLRAMLAALRQRFAGRPGDIDRKIFNANRLIKLPGTWARKGRQSDDRPYRVCRIVYVPAELVAVTADQIREVAATEGDKGAGGEVGRPVVAPQQNQFRLRAGESGSTAYVRAALEGECAKVALARPPAQGGEGRNNALNAAAFSLGQLEWTGHIDEGTIVSRLTAAAVASGLADDPGCGARGIESTIRSGLEAGRRARREIPRDPVAQPATPAAAAVPEGELIIQWASEVETRPVEWLMPNRIPLGKLTTFAGVGGLGKTFVLCDITARVTRGFEWPDGSGECASVGRVLFISGEDEPEDTLVPRMIEMGADLSRVAFLKTAVQDRFTLADIETLRKALSQMGGDVRLIAIDPPTAYLGGVNDHKNAELRQLLTPLKSLAAERRVAIIFNTHVSKPQGAKVEAMMRVMGSVAWVNAVRAAHMFARDPNDPERRLFVGMKNNLGPEQKGLAYKLTASGNLAKIEWLGQVDTTADEAINNAPRERRDVTASEFLVELFRQKLEWPSDELFREARAQNISRNAVFEAKRLLKLPKAKKVVHENGNEEWVWWVPPNWTQLSRPEDAIGTVGTLEPLEV